MTRILGRARTCRCHWHGRPNAWRCCWCDDISDDSTKPAHRTAECYTMESFALYLPPERDITAPDRRRGGRRAAA